MALRLVYITAKDKAEAKKIGNALLAARVAACVNIIEHMESMYWWEGKIEESSEAVLIAKTDSSLVGEVIALVKKTHNYSVPCVLSLPVETGNPDYVNWLKSNLAAKKN